MTTSKLYDEVVLDHIRHARNYRVIEHPDRRAEAVNPLCGDQFTIYATLDGDVITDLAFQCECCGISMASASIMTEWLRGRTVAQALETKAAFLAALKDANRTAGDAPHPDHAAVLDVVHGAPAREGCAKLAWEAMEQAVSAVIRDR
ncbi:MAG: SUF system NifU family Fe-S cluster assembly protein [Burkholderiales bacterium]